MPNPKNYSSEKDFISVCIPQVLKEGTAKDQKQAAAICYSMWRDKNKSEKAKTVGGYESPEPGDISPKKKDVLANVYAKCRADGGDKEKCAKIAWSAVHNMKKDVLGTNNGGGALTPQSLAGNDKKKTKKDDIRPDIKSDKMRAQSLINASKQGKKK